MSRYAVFIDGGYYRKVLKEFGSPAIDLLKLSNEFSNGDERLRTYYYDCAPYIGNPPTVDDQKRQKGFDSFRQSIENLPRFQVRLGRLQRIVTAAGIRFEQKKVDVLLAVDLLKLSIDHQIQRAIIIAGDSDFTLAIIAACDAGTVTELYYHIPPKAHNELLSACDERHLITKDLINIVLKK